ncbi:hypothetical protein F5Y05DRAFT_10024 [Hypoxylon sp. FL0543]|nr:hypothetical protein F5Y05DRAFT_10024 [Hypoxylon sp. FL0543]
MRVHKANQMINDNYVRHFLALLEQRGELVQADRMSKNATQFDVKLSYVDIGANLDFGIPGAGNGVDGKARWVRKPWADDIGTVNILPRRDDDADYEIMVCLDCKQIELVRLSLEERGFTTITDYPFCPVQPQPRRPAEPRTRRVWE